MTLNPKIHFSLLMLLAWIAISLFGACGGSEPWQPGEENTEITSKAWTWYVPVDCQGVCHYTYLYEHTRSLTASDDDSVRDCYRNLDHQCWDICKHDSSYSHCWVGAFKTR